MSLRVAVQFAWPKAPALLRLCLEFRLGSTTTVSPKQQGKR